MNPSRANPAPPVHLAGITIRSDRFPDPDVHPFRVAALRGTARLSFGSPVTCFVGENGSGKSTLLEAIARACRIHIWRREDGRRVEHNRWERRLHEYLEVSWTRGPVPGSFFGAEDFRTLASLIEEWAAADPGQLAHFGGHSLLTLSHGQSLMAFFRARYRIPGLYLLDEPEAALSPRTQVALLRLLDAAARRGTAQFIVATHSPILLACPGAALWSFDGAAVAPVAYGETEHVRLYREFLADPKRFLGAGPVPFDSGEPRG